MLSNEEKQGKEEVVRTQQGADVTDCTACPVLKWTSLITVLRRHFAKRAVWRLCYTQYVTLLITQFSTKMNAFSCSTNFHVHLLQATDPSCAVVEGCWNARRQESQSSSTASAGQPWSWRPFSFLLLVSHCPGL